MSNQNGIQRFFSTHPKAKAVALAGLAAVVGAIGNRLYDRTADAKTNLGKKIHVELGEKLGK